MDLNLAGKTALVTGASLGIGRAIAAELAQEGVAVAINARNAARLGDAAAALARGTDARSAPTIVPIAGDMGEPVDIARVIDAARAALGRIDILINNAGSSPAGRIDDTGDEVWWKSLNLKLMGYVRCARAVLPEMRARRWGRVVNIIGRSGHQPRAAYVAGGAVNAALLNVTKSLAEEVAPDNVLVTGVNPGPIQTPRWDSLMEQGARTEQRAQDQVQAQALASVPLGRLGTPEEVAGMVAFLCSDRASFITGTLINIDGGGTRCI